MSTPITVMASGSAEPGLNFVAAVFEKETGHTVKIAYNEELKAFDVLVATNDAMKRKYLPAAVVEQGGVSIGRLGIGVTVRSGAPAPDVSSMDAFKQAFLQADAILLTTHTSGLYIEDVLKKMGIFEQVNARIRRFDSAPALMDGLLAGKGREFSILSTNQIRRNRERGLVLAGPVPDEVQDYREFVAAPAAHSANKEAARAFVRYCGGPGRAILIENGFV